MDEVLTAVELGANTLSKAVFSSSVCGSWTVHGMNGRRCSRLESIASFNSGASAGS